MGCPILDGMMGGGIQCGLITELVGAQYFKSYLEVAIIDRARILSRELSVNTAGEATAGKTQTCLQLLLTVQWPMARGGLEGSAL